MKIITVTYDNSLRGGITNVNAIFREFFPDMHFHFANTARSGMLKYLWFLLKSWLKFFNLVLANKPCIVHIHTGSRWDYIRHIPYILFTKLVGVPLLLHFRGNLNGGFFRNGAVAQAIIKKVICLADLHVFLSPTLEKDFHKRVSESRSLSIPNPLTSDYLSLEVTPLGERRHKILFMGRYNNDKGIRELAAAAANHVAEDSEIEYEAYGEGPLPSNCPERTSWRGWARDPYKRECYRHSKILVLPSYTEGFPNCILEAMACGTPVVATCVGGIPDMIQHGVHGLLVLPQNVEQLEKALKRLINDEGLWQTCSENCRKDASKYEAGRIKKLWEIVYEELGDRSRTQHGLQETIERRIEEFDMQTRENN